MSSFKRAKISFFNIRLLRISLKNWFWKRFFDRAELDPNHAVVLFHGEGLLIENFGRKNKKGCPRLFKTPVAARLT
jgi:hypothetical protein